MLELRGVSKVYGRAAGGRVEALADLTFEVKPTELAVVVGPRRRRQVDPAPPRHR